MYLDPGRQGHCADAGHHALDAGAAKKNQVSGSVSLQYFTHIRETSLSSSLEFIARVYPDIYLSVLHSSDANPSLDRLRPESADILIVPGMLLGDHFVEHHRWSDHYVLAVARSKRAASRSLGELLHSTRYVAWRHAGSERLHSQLAAAQVRLSHRGELSCADTLLDLVAKGHCLSIVPGALLTGHTKELEAMPLPVGIARQVSVVARPASLLSSAALVVLQALKKPALKAVQGY